MEGSWAIWLMSHALFVQWAVERWEGIACFGVQDAYKFVFQATRGGEHAIENEDAAKRWLEAEWESLGEPLEGEAVIEPLVRNGSVVRLNLRPYKKMGGDKDRLFTAFVKAAREFRSDSTSFELAWRLFGEVLKRRSVSGVTRKEWEILDASAKTAGYPAMHHSEVYAAIHRPAYRVMTGEAARKLVSGL